MKTYFNCNWMCHSFKDGIQIYANKYSPKEKTLNSEYIDVFIERLGRVFNVEEKIYNICFNRADTPIDYVLPKRGYYT